MSVVHGKDAIFMIYHAGMWKVCACAREISLNVTTGFIETSISGTNTYSTFLPTKSSFTGSASGVVSLNNLNMLALPDLRSIQLANIKMLGRYQRTAQDGTVYTDEIYFYISNTTDTGNFNDVSTFSLEFQGTGVITQIFTPTSQSNDNPVIRYDSYTPVQDATGFTEATLIGKYIVEVVKDGVGQQIITVGTPVGKECKYTSASGAFEFGVPFDAAEDKPYVLYRNI